MSNMQQVKTLRERTGAPMQDCLKALNANSGDLEAAEQHLRREGLLKAEKKSHRTTSAGRIQYEIVSIAQPKHSIGMVLELNCETDFVARGEPFIEYANQLAQLAVTHQAPTKEALMALRFPSGLSAEEERLSLVATIGENIQLRRYVCMDTTYQLGGYSHSGRIGVLVDMEGGDDALLKDICMHIAAQQPPFIDRTAIPVDYLDAQRNELMHAADLAGKPDAIKQKMIDGRLNKHLETICLVYQPFVKNPDQTVGALLEEKGARIHRFSCLVLGEGIEHKTTDFAEEVRLQVEQATRS